MTNSGQTPRIFQGRYRSALSYLGALTTAQITAIAAQPEGTLVYDTDLEDFLIYNAAGVPVLPPAVPTGPAGGDLSGTYPDPSVIAVTDLEAGTAGEVLLADGLGGFTVGPPTPDFARTITVALSGGDFTTISAGLTAAAALAPPPSAGAPATVLVYPGTYVETITLLAFVSLVGVGGPSSVNIVAPLTTATIVTGAASSSLRGVTLSGASGAGGIGLSHTVAGLPLVLFNCAVLDCETGYSFSGAGVAVSGSFITALRFPGQVLVTALEVLAGAAFKASNINIEGTGASRITTALSVDGVGSVMTVAIGLITFADDGVLADTSGTANVNTTEIRSAVNGVHAGSTGTPTIQGADITIVSSSTLDVLQDTVAGTLLLTSSNFLSTLTSIPAGSASILTHVSLDTDNEAFTIFGDLHVGAPFEGWTSALGEGSAYVNTMNVFRNTSGETGAYTDVTASAASPSGSAFSAFPGVTAGNVMFIGGSVTFSGIFSNTIVAMALGAGAVVWEFWDGASWTAFNVMASDAQAPLAQYANTPLERINTESVRFGPMAGWTTKTLTSDPFGAGSKFWVRARISAAITTSPTMEQIKLQPNSSQINDDGALEFFGDARVERPLAFHRIFFTDLVGQLAPDEDLLFTTNIQVVTVDNRFSDGAVDGVGTESFIPLGLDTSSPLRFDVLWAGDTATGAAAVELEVNFASIKVGDILDGSASDSLLTAIIAQGAFTAQELIETPFSLPIPTLLENELLALTVFRDATGGNADDTYGGDVYMVDLHVTGLFWR